MEFAALGQTLFSGLANGALYAFVALGFGLVNRSTGIINFAQGDLAMLGAVMTAVMSAAGVPLILAVPIAVLACGLVSGLFYLVVLRFADGATMSQQIIITIGFSILIRGAVTSLWGTAPMAVPAFTGSAPFNVYGVSILPQSLWLISTLLLVGFAVALLFRHTMVGLALRAGAANPLGASFVGIDYRRLGLYAFIGSGLLGGIGGAVWSPIGFPQVDVGIGIGIKGFTAAVLGGIATPFGPLIGGFLFGLLEALTAGFLSSAYQQAISFGLLLLLLLVLPQGLMGGRIKRNIDVPPEETLTGGAAVTHFVWTDVAKIGVGLVVLLALGQLMQGWWITSAIFAGILAMVVMGMVLLTGYAGQLSLGQGAFMMIGAYSSAWFTMKMGWPPLAGLATGIVLAIVVALILGRVIFRLHGYVLAMASLGLLMITLTLARELVGITGGPNGTFGIPPFSIFGKAFVTDGSFYYVVAAFSLAVLLACLSVTRSQFGRALLAIRSNELAARSFGVRVSLMKGASLAFSAAAAAIGGSLYVHYLGIANPSPFDDHQTIIQLTALTLGGFLSLWGAYVGSILVIALPTMIAWVSGHSESQVVAGMQYILFGLLLIVVITAQANSQIARLIAGWRRRLLIRHPAVPKVKPV